MHEASHKTVGWFGGVGMQGSVDRRTGPVFALLAATTVGVAVTTTDSSGAYTEAEDVTAHIKFVPGTRPFVSFPTLTGTKRARFEQALASNDIAQIPGKSKSDAPRRHPL